jgi:hypothetical protein
MVVCLTRRPSQPLRALVELQSLGMRECVRVSDLMALGAMVKLQSLDMSGCRSVSDLAPLTALVNLQRLKIGGCNLSPCSCCCSHTRTPPLVAVWAAATLLTIWTAPALVSTAPPAPLRPPAG